MRSENCTESEISKYANKHPRLGVLSLFLNY